MKHCFSFFAFTLLVGLLAGCSGQHFYKKGLKRTELGEYQLAVGQFEKALARNFAPGPVNYALAEAYRLSDRPAKAADYYGAALAAGATDKDVRYHYAFALKAQGKYDEAAAQLDQYVKSAPNSLTNVARAKKEIENLASVKEIANAKTSIEIQNLAALNTQAAEFSPVFRNDELVFTSSRKELVYKANGLGFLGMYRIGFAGQKPDSGAVKLFTDKVNEENRNEGSPTFSKDGKLMIFARGNTGRRKDRRPDVDLYLARYKDGNWTPPALLSVSDSAAWDACPAISTDGKTLYFASNRGATNPKSREGFGGIDLYRCSLDATGRVGRAVNMGKDINTAGDDLFPYVSQDAKLYFASDGHPGLGGLDLFVATRVGGKTGIRNLGVPLNSVADDFAISYRTPTTGFFSSNREGGKGDDDVYFFEDKTPNTKLVNYFLTGTTVKADDDAPLDQVKVTFQDEDGKTIDQVTTKADGKFGSYPLKEGRSYTLVVERPDYFTKREPFSMAGRGIPQEALTKPQTDTTFQLIIPLEPIVVVKPGEVAEGEGKRGAIVLENVYFDFDKADIRDDAAEELDKFVQFLTDNPQILRIELSSHTDAKGRDVYNEELSQRRANSVVQYLISKGISTGRLAPKGYGERLPVADNENPDGTDNPDGRQLNRRTEFRVLEKK